MDDLYDLIERFFDLLYNSLVEPAVHGIGFLLNAAMRPIDFLSPFYQIMAVAVIAAVLSRLLGRRFSSRREKRLHKQFKEKLASLKHTADVGDKKLERILRKGVSQSADEVYENIIMDKFFEMGVSYFFPMFFFIIWLEYDRFSPEALKALTGSPFAWVSGSGLGISAAYVFLYLFNIFLLSFWLVELAVRFVRKRLAKASDNS